MDPDSTLSLILIFVLLIMGAYFASCEIALSSVNKIRIRILADRGEKKARNVLYILDNFDVALSTILIGNNLSHILSSSIATVTATRLWGTNSVAAVTLVLTVVVFFFAELLPKNMAKKYSETYSQTIAGSLIFFMKLSAPFAYMLTKLAQAAADVAGGTDDRVTEDEFYDMVENIAEDGSLDEEKGELVQSVISFADLTVGDILTSRVDMVAIDDQAPVEKITEIIKTVHHSNLPVYHGSIDNVVGVLSCRKYIKEYLKKGDDTDIHRVMDKPFFIHNSTDIADLLPEMNRHKASLAIVIDDYGGIEGIVTMENALEELVGDIWDEEDIVSEDVMPLGENTFEVQASMDARECFEKIGFDDFDPEETERKTMVGLVYDAFDIMPRQGDSFMYKNLKITVHKMKNQRILTLKIEKQEVARE